MKSSENIKNTLRTFQPKIRKSLRTSQPQKKITGPYIKKLQNYSPRLGTVIFEAFSLRKRNSRRYTTKQLKKS